MKSAEGYNLSIEVRLICLTENHQGLPKITLKERKQYMKMRQKLIDSDSDNNDQ